MVMISGWIVFAALAATLPGLVAWLLTRRYGLAGVLGALAVCALIAVVGWPLTREVRVGDAMHAQAIVIFWIVVPALVSLVLGAVVGFWSALQRRDQAAAVAPDARLP